MTAYKQLGAAWLHTNSWGQPDSIYITAEGSLTVHTNIWREPGSAYKQLGTAWQCIQLLSAIWQCIQLLRTGWLHTTVEDRLIAYNCWGQADCIQWLRTGWLHTTVEARLIAYNGWGQADCIQLVRTGWLHTTVVDRLIAYSGWGQADCIQWLRTGWQYLPLLRAAWQKTMSWAIRLLSPIPNISMLLQMFRVICQHTISWAFRTPTMLFLIYQERDSILQCTPDTPAPTTKTREVYNFCLSPFICLFATWKRGLP